MTPGKLRALVKDLWQNSPIDFVLADGTPLRIVSAEATPARLVRGDRNKGEDDQRSPPGLTVWLEPTGSADIPPPAQTVPMTMYGRIGIDDVPGTGD